MEIKVEKLSQCKVTVKVTCEKELFNEALEYSFNENVKEVEVKGFRKGHCPKNVYLAKFGEASLYEKAIDKLLNDTYYKAIVENKLRVVAAPKIDFDHATIGRDKEFTYTAEVEIYPDITLGQYKGVEVTKDPVLVTDEEVNNEINKTLKSKAELVLVEGRTLQNGDTAVFDFEGSVDGVPFDGGKADNYELKIGSGQFIPGFEDQMVGMASEEVRDINVTFPENYQAENLAGKAAVFKVTLHEIKEEVLPELTDDFVKELEIKEVETVDAYKADVLNKLTKQKTEASDNKLVSDIIAKVCEDAVADIPEALVEEEVNNYVRRVEEQAKMYGLTAEQLLSFQGTNVEGFKNQVRESASKKVLEEVVLYKVSEVENIEATDEEIEKKYAELADLYGQSVDTIKGQISKENLTGYIINLKTVDFLKENAKIN